MTFQCVSVLSHLTSRTSASRSEEFKLEQRRQCKRRQTVIRRKEKRRKWCRQSYDPAPLFPRYSSLPFLKRHRRLQIKR